MSSIILLVLFFNRSITVRPVIGLNRIDTSFEILIVPDIPKNDYKHSDWVDSKGGTNPRVKQPSVMCDFINMLDNSTTYIVLSNSHSVLG